MHDELRNGPVPSNDIKKRSNAVGHSWRTVERVKAQLKIKSKKDGISGKWSFFLPEHFCKKTDEIPEVRQHRHVLDGGVLGGLASEEVTL